LGGYYLPIDESTGDYAAFMSKIYREFPTMTVKPYNITNKIANEIANKTKVSSG
jgi:hypothetical protein